MTSNDAPHCSWCKHYLGSLQCKVFPERIPDDILFGEDGHRTPHKGDGGIIFELNDGEVDKWVGLRGGKN